MRRFVLSCLVNTGSPTLLSVGSNCAEPIAIANGQSPGFGGMGGSYAGTALNIASLTDGGTYTPGATYQLSTTSSARNGLYVTAGSLAGAQGCANKYRYSNTGAATATWTSPQAGTVSVIGMHASGRRAVAYEVLTLTAEVRRRRTATRTARNPSRRQASSTMAATSSTPPSTASATSGPARPSPTHPRGTASAATRARRC